MLVNFLLSCTLRSTSLHPLMLRSLNFRRAKPVNSFLMPFYILGVLEGLAADLAQVALCQWRMDELVLPQVTSSIVNSLAPRLMARKALRLPSFAAPCCLRTTALGDGLAGWREYSGL